MKTPITLITGYLGAGKTTLLRHLIDSAAGRKMAVLMNEFGQIAIDSRMIKGRNINMIELKGGCVCCSLTGEFEAAIKEIREKINPELIVIETTGVAEPDAIIGDLSTIEGVRLDAVVTVVDADAMLRFPSIGHTGRMQIEMADILLLNKADMVSEADLAKIENMLGRINPKVEIIRVVYAKIEPDLIFDMGFGRKAAEKREHDHHITESGLGHMVYESNKKLDKEKLEEFFYNVPKDIVRAKGFVVTDQGSFLLNYVFGRFDFEEFDADKNELVFIGKNIEGHENQILKSIKACEVG